MFTGIIENLGKVESVDASVSKDQATIIVETGFEDLEIGESVAVNGICLTVVENMKSSQALFFVSNETLKKSSLQDLKEGSVVNLERALTLNKRISGHLVQGHVDGTALLKKIENTEDTWKFTYYLEKKLSRYCIEKGSIAIDGISLTVCDLISLNSETDEFSVYIIPHTLENTNLSIRKTEDRVNVEMDMMAKHLERLCLTNEK